LKELELTEDRATGIPTILKSLKDNGSPSPKFNTDDDHSFFEVELFIHETFAEKVPHKFNPETIQWNLESIDRFLNLLVESVLGGIAEGIADGIAEGKAEHVEAKPDGYDMNDLYREYGRSSLTKVTDWIKPYTSPDSVVVVKTTTETIAADKSCDSFEKLMEKFEISKYNASITKIINKRNRISHPNPVEMEELQDACNEFKKIYPGIDELYNHYQEVYDYFNV
jgi:hypothetical protein